MDTDIFTPTKRVCLLTGGSGTFGHAFCQLHAHDYHIVALYNQHPIADTIPLATRAALQSDPESTVYSHAVNLMRFDLMQDMLTRVLAVFGRVDVLIHAAASYNQVGSWLAQGSLVPTVAVLHVNLLSLLQLVTMLTRRQWKTDPAINAGANRNVIALSSVSGLEVFPGGQELYSASKAGLNMLTRHLAENLAPFQVRANALCPDTFPAKVPTSLVVAAARACDQGTMTGQVTPVVTG